MTRAQMLAKVLAEHDICWGTCAAGSWYAYCSCSRWSATEERGSLVVRGHEAHVAAALDAALEADRIVGGQS